MSDQYLIPPGHDATITGKLENEAAQKTAMVGPWFKAVRKP